jgi:ATP-dependent exoDNAse (exonuclease V) alpha subunit
VAVFHLSVKVFKRSAGHVATQKAAYRSGQKIYDEHRGRTFDFTRKRGVIHAEVHAPDHAPDFLRDRAKLWNCVEGSEGRQDAQLAREVEVAIPHELSREARLELVREFVRDQFVSQGMIADVCWHEVESAKPHAHIMLTMRAIDPDGRGFGNKVRAWNAHSLVRTWRSQWEEYANRALQREGHEERIDHRSYADRGVALEPQTKVGRAVSDLAADRRDAVHQNAAECEAIARHNGELIAADPNQLLEVLTSRQSTFSRDQLLRALNTHTADASTAARQRLNCSASAVCVLSALSSWSRETVD